MKKQKNDLLFALKTVQPIRKDVAGTYGGIGIEHNIENKTLNVLVRSSYLFIKIEIKDFNNINRLPEGDYVMCLDSFDLITQLIKTNNEIDISQYIKCNDFVEFAKGLGVIEEVSERSLFLNPVSMAKLIKANESLLSYMSVSTWERKGMEVKFIKLENRPSSILKTEIEIENIKMTCLTTQITKNS